MLPADALLQHLDGAFQNLFVKNDVRYRAISLLLFLLALMADHRKLRDFLCNTALLHSVGVKSSKSN